MSAKSPPKGGKTMYGATEQTLKTPLLADKKGSGSPAREEKQSQPEERLPAVPVVPADSVSVGVPKETWEGEKRVSVTPDSVKILKAKGVRKIVVESGAGLAAKFTDEQYTAAGATIGDAADAFQCDLVLKVRPPQKGELDLLHANMTLICTADPNQDKALVETMTGHKGTLVALNLIPRITRAQAYDILSSMANIGGYRAVIEAANSYGSFFMGQITAAGRVPAAKVLVIGAGVAGLAAAGVAKGMGAIVRAFDTRPAVKEEVETMGAQFLQVKLEELGDGGGGYAKVMSPEFIAAEMDLFMQQCKEVDIVITTALIPGRKAPVLLTKEHVAAMKEGSVIVDMAAENGGNCELTQKGKKVEQHGVNIIGYTDLVSRVPKQSSIMFSNNVTRFLTDLWFRQEGFSANLKDEVIRGSTVTVQGQMIFPPPKKPEPPKKEPKGGQASGREDVAPPKPPSFWQRNWWLSTPLSILTLGIILLVLGYYLEEELVIDIMVFTLAVFLGYKVVWGVLPSLHSPLMSLTNALSGVILVGGLENLGSWGSLPNVLAVFACAIATINIFGGFLVTQRMLNMFKAKEGEAIPVTMGQLTGAYLLPITAVSAVFLGVYYDVAAQDNMVTLLYCLAALMFIAALSQLSDAPRARLGNLIGIVGMVYGFVATLAVMDDLATDWWFILVAMVPGAIVGCIIAVKVSLVELPELVAAFHSLVGLAAVLAAIASYVNDITEYTGSTLVVHQVVTFLGVLIGGVTFTGSVIAFGKLHALIPSKPFVIPLRHWFTLLLFVILFVGMGYFVALDKYDTETGLYMLLGCTGLSFILGIHLIIAIGGGDMPVVISMLNSYSGWACAADGFLLNNYLLIVAGALIGSSGAILSYVMCAGMGRSFVSVIAGGWGEGAGSKKPKGSAEEDQGEVQPIDAAAVASKCLDARKVMIVPGYGMAVSKAQHEVAVITRTLQAKGVDVTFCVHPVAGRMPGHMNVLIAEAQIPYDIVKELDECKDKFKEQDVVICIGSNDTINPAAIDDPDSDIYGMPVCNVWDAKAVVVLKRSMATGYAGVQNPLFFKENAFMLFGDAKKTCSELAKRLQEAVDA